MSDNNMISEGILSQLKKSIFDEIPDMLKMQCEEIDGFDIESEVSDIVEQYLVADAKIDTASYEQSKTPEVPVQKKLMKKKRYHIDKLYSDLKNEYEKASSNQRVAERISPYSESALAVVRSTAQLPRQVAIENTNHNINKYFERLEEIKPIKNGIEACVGFCEYPYFDLLREGNRAWAKRLLKIDIEEYVFRISFSKQYKNYVVYQAESVGRGFYGETSRRKKKDLEYELVSSQYLKDAFFPDVEGVSQISIEAKKPWDTNDMALFSFLCTKSRPRIIGEETVLLAEGNLRELCGVLYENSTEFSSKHYSLARARLENIYDTTVTAVVNGDKILKKHLFDLVLMDNKKDETKERSNGVYYHVEFGRHVTGDILSHRISTIIKPQLDELENSVSKMLYVQLKKDRAVDLYVSASKNADKETTTKKSVIHEYTLILFMMLFRVRDAKKAARIARYTDALNEMKEKGILIHDFKVKDDNFIVEWIPLSDAEWLDIKVIKNPEGVPVIETSYSEL